MKPSALRHNLLSKAPTPLYPLPLRLENIALLFLALGCLCYPGGCKQAPKTTMAEPEGSYATPEGAWLDCRTIMDELRQSIVDGNVSKFQETWYATTPKAKELLPLIAATQIAEHELYEAARAQFPMEQPGACYGLGGQPMDSEIANLLASADRTSFTLSGSRAEFNPGAHRWPHEVIVFKWADGRWRIDADVMLGKSPEDVEDAKVFRPGLIAIMHDYAQKIRAGDFRSLNDAIKDISQQKMAWSQQVERLSTKTNVKP